MGLQSDSTIVAVFLFVLATFSLVVGAFALAVTVGRCLGAGGDSALHRGLGAHSVFTAVSMSSAATCLPQ